MFAITGKQAHPCSAQTVCDLSRRTSVHHVHALLLPPSACSYDLAALLAVLVYKPWSQKTGQYKAPVRAAAPAQGLNGHVLARNAAQGTSLCDSSTFLPWCPCRYCWAR